MAIVPDQSILDALRGYAVESSKQPIPRLIKIYISSTKHGMYSSFPLKVFCCIFTYAHHCCFYLEFKEERKVLLEVIGPELQSVYDDRQIEVGCVESIFLNKCNFFLFFM